MYNHISFGHEGLFHSNTFSSLLAIFSWERKRRERKNVMNLKAKDMFCSFGEVRRR